MAKAAAQQLIAEIQSLDAGEPPPDDVESGPVELPDDLPETLPW